MLLFNRYEYNPQTDLIGKGGFSRVYRALDKKLNRPVALKIYKTNEIAEKYSPIAEIQRVIEFDHPNISRYIDIDEIENENAFGEREKIQVCVMELLSGGNLAQYYQGNKDITVFKKLLTDVLNGLSYLHQNDIIHRDIKPGNILIKNTVKGPVAKITDFGISKRSDSSFNSSSSALIVSIPYMAPEQLNIQRYGIDDKISYNIDLWSLGVTVYEIISGDMLFKNNVHESSEQIMTNIMMPELPAKIDLLPQPFREFVHLCIVKDAKERVKRAEDLIPILERNYNIDHPAVEPIIQSEKSNVASTAQVESTSLTADSEQEEDGISIKEEDVTQVLSKKQLPGAEEEYPEEIKRFLPKTATDNDFSLPVSNELVAADDTLIIPKKELPLSEDTQVMSKKELPDPDDTQILRKKEITGSAPTETPAAFHDEPIQQPVRDTDTASLGKKEKSVNLFHRYDYYPFSALIGKGGFSRVYKAYDKKLNRWVALKIYKTGEFSERYSPISEIRRVVNLDHPNICRYLDIEEIEKENPFGENEITQICVMELMDSGNFAEYYHKNRKPDILKKLLRNVLNGLAYLHRNGIIHRDIKPANILVKTTTEGPVAKITDFGISKAPDTINSNSSSSIVVSIPYMAPEQLNIKKYGIDEKISYNLDLWALGVTVYEIITEKVLFKNNETDSSEQIMTNIMSVGIPEKIKELPEPFRKIVTMCVVKNARDRAQRAEDLIQYLDESERIPLQDKMVVPPPPVQPIVLKEKKSLFLEEERKQPEKPVKKDKRKPVVEPTAPQKKYFSNTVLGVIAAIIIVPSIIIWQPWSSNDTPGKDLPLVPLTDHPRKKDTVENIATIDTLKKNSIPEEPVSDKKKETKKTKVEDPKTGEIKQTKAEKVEANDKTVAVVTSNKKVKIRIKSSKDCSLKIVDTDNKNYDTIEKIVGGYEYEEYIPPGTYVITATDLKNISSISQGRLTVTSKMLGKINWFNIAWKD